MMPIINKSTWLPAQETKTMASEVRLSQRY